MTDEEFIKDALKFLDEREPLWKLDKPIDRKAYIKNLLKERRKTAKKVKNDRTRTI